MKACIIGHVSEAMSKRPPLIVGNWKMYKTIDEATQFIDRLTPIALSAPCKVVLAVPFTAIKPCADKARGTNIIIAAQNMNDASEGAFTGEIAAAMLKDAGAEYVILGHSERRSLFHETNAFINKKVKRATLMGLKPILCIGETRDERADNKTASVIKEQLTECLRDVVGAFVLAYEPVWAIGTGKPATPQDVQTVAALCREILAEIVNADVAAETAILYGGSVVKDNAGAYLQEPDIDGLLIGSASLDPDTLITIIGEVQS